MNSLSDAFRAHHCPKAATLVEMLVSEKQQHVRAVHEDINARTMIHGLPLSEEVRQHLLCVVGMPQKEHVSPMHSMKRIGMQLEAFSKDAREAFNHACGEIVRLATPKQLASVTA